MAAARRVLCRPARVGTGVCPIICKRGKLTAQRWRGSAVPVGQGVHVRRSHRRRDKVRGLQVGQTWRGTGASAASRCRCRACRCGRFCLGRLGDQPISPFSNQFHLFFCGRLRLGGVFGAAVGCRDGRGLSRPSGRCVGREVGMGYRGEVVKSLLDRRGEAQEPCMQERRGFRGVWLGRGRCLGVSFGKHAKWIVRNVSNVPNGCSNATRSDRYV